LKIHVITTGGTIDKVYFDAKSEFQVGEPQVLDVFREAHVGFEFTIESVLRKDSLEMTDADRELIRERAFACPSDRILITHGTDTMIKTAQALAGIANKTIVLTGSMQPARFRGTDAVFNIGTAIGVVQSLPAGVYIAMNGRVFDPDHARKNLEKHCFEDAV
jgi:L-asparaginase